MKRWICLLLAAALAVGLLLGAAAEDGAPEEASEEQPEVMLEDEEAGVSESDLISEPEEPAAELAPDEALAPPEEITAEMERVLQLQYWLIVLDYMEAEEMTGEYDDITRAAVRIFQENSGLDATGVCDSATWALVQALAEGTASPTPEPSASPAPGYTEKEIMEIQTCLVRLGYLAEDGASGRMDAATTSAIAAFQADSGLEATGMCDEATLERLKAQAEAEGGMAARSGARDANAGPTPTPDPRLRGVTPGKALGSGHARGDGSTAAYGAADLTDGAAGLNISLEAGANAQALREAEFTAALSDGTLTLSGGEGAVQRWTFDGALLRALWRGGIGRLAFTGVVEPLALNTGGLFAGREYDALRAAGHTDNTFLYTVTLSSDGAADIAVEAGGALYTAAQAPDGAWTLARKEGGA